MPFVNHAPELHGRRRSGGRRGLGAAERRRLGPGDHGRAGRRGRADASRSPSPTTARRSSRPAASRPSPPTARSPTRLRRTPRARRPSACAPSTTAAPPTAAPTRAPPRRSRSPSRPSTTCPASPAAPTSRSFENAAAQTVPGWATAITPGPADEAGQAVSFAVTNDATALFASAASPRWPPTGRSPSRPRRARTASRPSACARVDDGGTANAGADTSAAQTFVITIVNRRAQRSSTTTPSVLENSVAGVTFNVLANDTDPESDALSLDSYDDSALGNGASPTTAAAASPMSRRRTSPARTRSRTPSTDGNGGTSTAAVTITVTPVARPAGRGRRRVRPGAEHRPRAARARRARERRRLGRRRAARRHDARGRPGERRAQPRRRRLLHLHADARLHGHRLFTYRAHERRHRSRRDRGRHAHRLGDVQHVAALPRHERADERALEPDTSTPPSEFLGLVPDYDGDLAARPDDQIEQRRRHGRSRAGRRPGAIRSRARWCSTARSRSISRAASAATAPPTRTSTTARPAARPARRSASAACRTTPGTASCNGASTTSRSAP